MTSVFDDIILTGATRVPPAAKFQVSVATDAAGLAAYRRLRHDVRLRKRALQTGIVRQTVSALCRCFFRGLGWGKLCGNRLRP